MRNLLPRRDLFARSNIKTKQASNHSFFMSASELERLAQRAISCFENSPNHRILIAVVGIPGSGKSTVAEKVSNVINHKAAISGKNCKSIVTGMDGFHLTRQQLSQSEDPQHAFKRRGAPFTFDGNGMVEFVKELRRSCTVENPPVVKAPSFDHKLKDPVPGGVTIEPDVNIVIIEGLYLMSTEEPWNQLGELMDERWLVEVDEDVARERLAKRHVVAGIEPDMELAYARVDQNDLLNGRYVLSHLAEGIDTTVANENS